MPNVLLSTKAAGDIVTLKVSGSPWNFIVVQQGRPASGNYDTSFDNVTWLLMQDIYDQRQWASSGNDYANSWIHSWLNNEASGFLSLLDADIRAVIPTVKIPYRPGSGISSSVSSGANGLACKAFLLSMLEVGLSTSYSPSEGATITYFTSGGNARRFANYNGSPSAWWTRSPSTGNSGRACDVSPVGTAEDGGVYSTYGCRPALPLPSNLYVSDDGSILTNEPPTAPGSIDVTAPVAGHPVTVTLTAATDPDGTIANYIYERKVDGGGWQQFASTSSLTTTDSINDSWTTVTYRAKAVDNMGAEGPYATSQPYTVMHNQPPTAPGSIDVTAPVAGQPVTVTLTAASDPDGTVAAYVIERRVDSGGWQQVYSGPALTCTDTVGADWQSVQYRAAAVDNEGAQGPYIESEVLPVRTGAVTITGPASGQGEHAQPFDVGPLTLGVTPAPSDPAVQLTVLLDGAEAVTASHAAGDEITLRIDPRVMARGDHTITVTAGKEAYTTAMAQYTYTVPAWDGSDIAGGKSGRFEDHLGNKLLPKTLAQDSLGPGGKDMATLITEVQRQLGQISPAEDVIRQAPPSDSFELAPGTLYDFTQAAATTLTFTLGAAEDGKAAAYHVRFQTGITPPTLTLPDSVRKPAGFELAAGRIYDMTIVEGLLTAQSWVLFDKTVLVSNVDASSGGNTFNKSTGFTAAADSVLILYMDFTFTGNNGDGSTYNNNTLCVGRNPDAWNDTACRLYMGSEPNGQGHGEQVLLVGFDETGQQYFDAPGGTIKRNRAVMRINYASGTMDFWINGHEIAKGFGAYASGGKNSCLGAINIANTEGAHRFYGTYHEISILSGALQDEQLRALTA